MELPENLKVDLVNEKHDRESQSEHESMPEIRMKANLLKAENPQSSLDRRNVFDSDESTGFFKKGKSKKREHSDGMDSQSEEDSRKCLKSNCDNSLNSCDINLNDSNKSTHSLSSMSSFSNNTEELSTKNDVNENTDLLHITPCAESIDLNNTKKENFSKVIGVGSSSESKFSPSPSNISVSSDEGTHFVDLTHEIEEIPHLSDYNSLLGSNTSSSNDSSSSSSSSDSASLFSSFEEDDDFDVRFNEGSVSSDDEQNLENIEKMLPSVLKKTLPADKFSFPKEIYLRQINGNSNKQRYISKFDTKVYSSRRMVQRLGLYRSLKKHDDCVNTVSFNDAGDILISGSNDRHVCLWNWAKNKSLLYFNTGHIANVYQAKFLPNSNDTRLITCGQDHQVRMCLLDECGLKSTSLLTKHERAVHKISMQPQMPNSFLTAGEDGVVYAIDVRENNNFCKKLLKPFRQRLNSNAIVCLYSIHCNPIKNHEFIVCGNCEEIRLYDQRNISKKKQNPVKEFQVGRDLLGQGEFSFDERSTTVTSAVYNYNGTEILASYNDNDVFLFNSESSSQYVFRYDGHRNFATIKGVNFYGPHGEYIVSGSDCGHIYIWDKKSESIVQWMKGDRDIVNCLESHPSFPILATSGLESVVKVWMPMFEGTEGLKERKDFQKVVKKNSYYKLADSRDDLGVNLFYFMASARQV